MLSHKPSLHDSGWFTQSGPEADVVLSSRVILSRNLSGLPFAHRLNADGKLLVRKRVEGAIQLLDQDFIALDRGALNPTVQRYFEERAILSAATEDIVYLTPDESTLIRLGSRDHVRLEAVVGGSSLTSAAQRAAEWDRLLEEQLPFAVSLQLGYLTAEIDRAGSALSAGVLMDMGATVRGATPSLWVEAAAERGIVVEEYGTAAGHRSTLFVVHTAGRAGESDEATIARLEEFVDALVHYEREARAALLAVSGPEMREAALRAYGLMSYARRINQEELFGWLELLRLAAGCGLVEVISLQTVTRLMFVGQAAHVALLVSTGGDEAERRATMVQRILAEGRGKDV